jgi:hypothetical protein
MPIKQGIAHARILSFLLLGVFYSMDLQAQQVSCAEIPDQLTQSTPVAVSPPGSIKVFVRGIDSRVYENDAVDIFSGWFEFPGNGLTLSEPAAILHQNTVKLFIRGIGNRIFENDGFVTGFQWIEVPGGGLTPSGPTAVVDGDNLKLFVRGLDNGIWENDFNGRDWSGWSVIPGGGLTLSRPAAVIDRGKLKLFVRVVGSGIAENDFNGSNWSGWSAVPGGGLTIAGPSALEDRGTFGDLPPVLRLFVTGLDDAVYENDFKTVDSQEAWSGWSKSQFTLTPSGPAGVKVFPNPGPFSGVPQLFARSEADTVLECFFP